jgi:hypothetical protein
MKQLFLLLVLLVVISCEKKELPVPKYDPPVVPIDTSSNSTAGPLLMSQVDMGNDYRTQIWFSLSENKVVYSNLKTDWDLAFESAETGWHLMLNGSKGMKVYKTSYSLLNEVNDTLGLGSNGKADMPSGNFDSTAIDNWWDNNKVYLVNRGYNELGKAIGYIKLKLISVTTTAYTFEYGDVFSNKLYQATVNKSQQKNFATYSFNTHQQVNFIEPGKTQYDLCFTNYTHLFLDPLQYYQVTGVLQNTYRTRVAKLSDVPFYEITKRDTLGRSFSTNRNTIGYDWKTFNLNENLYTVNLKICYIIQDSKGFYYKLRFVDFYNNTGMKGAPKFEFQRL